MSWACLSEDRPPDTRAPASDSPGPRIIHASCVALNGRGLLILGASGSGKSGLALMLMAWGCDLIGDDRIELRREGATLIADAAPRLRGTIEARGIGLLSAEAKGPVRVVLAVDLDKEETDRLPPAREIQLFGLALPLLRGMNAPHFAPALLQMLKTGRRDDL